MEERADYQIETDDAIEMLGKGYDHPSLEIHPEQTVITRRGWKMQEEVVPAFVKISTAFKYELKGISGNAMKVWIFIALSINRNTEQAHPGIRTIAKACGNISQNTVIACVKELEGLGLLTVNREDRKYNIYKIPDYVSANKTASKSEAVGLQTASASGGLTKEEEGNVFKVFEENISPLTGMVAQELGDLMDEHTPTWVVAAIREAALNGKRSIKYIGAILKRWKVEGYGTPHPKANGNGKQPTTYQEALQKAGYA